MFLFKVSVVYNEDLQSIKKRCDIKMEGLTDQQLVRKTLDGEKEAFSVLIKRYSKQIYSLTYRLTNDPEDARDLAQEAFIHIYKVLDKYDQKRSFFSWMYKVSSNVCYNNLRRNKSKKEVSLDKIIEFTPLVARGEVQPEERYVRIETQALVRKAVAELPEIYRMPLVLRYLEDLTYRQIAEVMDLPLTTIETRLYRGKALLQKRLRAGGEGGPVNEVSRN
jgi:RNA polymerase sigma-70 factor (ECF subfamily)